MERDAYGAVVSGVALMVAATIIVICVGAIDRCADERMRACAASECPGETTPRLTRDGCLCVTVPKEKK